MIECDAHDSPIAGERRTATQHAARVPAQAAMRALDP
jgi:hypothetical protein